MREQADAAGAWLRRLWAEHRWPVIGGVTAAVAVFVVGGYLLLKRPEDVSNPDAAFDPSAELEDTFERVNWPMYGLNPERTRFLPAGIVTPPFKVKWRYNARKLVEYSPIVVDGVVYGINNNGEAFALDAGKGRVLWRRDIATKNASAPAYLDGKLYFSNLEPGQLQAVNAETGRTIWRRALPGRTESSPVVARGKVVVGCECGTLFAFGKDRGRPIWQTEIGGAIKGGPALEDGILYVGAYGGIVAAVRLAGGGIKWESNAQSAGLGQTGNFYATPAVAYDRVYVGNTDGRMYSFEKESGDLAWSQSTGDYVYAAAAVADTTDTPPTVYFGSYDGTFYALDARSGDVRWSRPVGGGVSGAASVIGHTVYVANLAKTRTVGLNVRNGKRVFTFRDGAYNPAISDGKLLYLSGVKQLYALKPTDKPDRSGAVHGRHLKDQAAGGQQRRQNRRNRRRANQGQGG